VRGVYLSDGTVSVRDDLPDAPTAAGECRVAVLRAGVCATDLALARGYMGFRGVPGHEFVGRALDGPLSGRRVVGEINAGCGACVECRRGDPRHCPERTVLGILGRPGAFADHLHLPAENLLPVPDEVSDEAAVFVEPLAAALEITEQVAIEPGMHVLVAGDGRLGLLCAWVLSRTGASVAVAGRHPDRTALLPEGVKLHTGLLESPPGGHMRYDVAVEATGHAEALAALCAHVRPRGTIVLKTTSEMPAPIDLAPVVVDEQTLIGSRCGRFGPALDLLAAGAVPVERFVHARFGLDDAPAAFARAGERGVLKVLLEIGA
jgi:threonine dehydrogenase-like Zn-dependent dehydrogenase